MYTIHEWIVTAFTFWNKGEQCVYAIEISLVHFASKSYQDERCVFTIYPIGCDFQNP